MFEDEVEFPSLPAVFIVLAAAVAITSVEYVLEGRPAPCAEAATAFVPGYNFCHPAQKARAPFELVRSRNPVRSERSSRL